MHEDPEMRDFFENYSMIKIAILDLRDAFFGGHTGNIVTRYEVTDTENIRYVCSVSIRTENGYIFNRYILIFISRKTVSN